MDTRSRWNNIWWQKSLTTRRNERSNENLKPYMTQKEKVLAMLIRNGGWLHTYETQHQGDLFVGHRGPARISELANDYPELVETDKTEKTYKYRFRFDNVHVALDVYPKWRVFVREELKKAKAPFKEYKIVYEDTGLGTVRAKKVLI